MDCNNVLIIRDSGKRILKFIPVDEGCSRRGISVTPFSLNCNLIKRFSNYSKGDEMYLWVRDSRR